MLELQEQDGDVQKESQQFADSSQPDVQQPVPAEEWWEGWRDSY